MENTQARMPSLTVRRVEADTSSGKGLILVTFGLLAVGVVMVYSAVASVAVSGKWYASVDFRHALFAALAGVVLLATWRVDYRIIAKGKTVPIIATGLLLFALLCGALVYVPGIGKSVGGYDRWIRLGPKNYGIGFQPSELIKFALVIWLAAWLSKRGTHIRSFTKTFLPALLVTGACLALVAREDFGTAVVITIGACAVMFLAGVPWYYLLTLLPPAVAGFYQFVVMNPRKWNRILAMFDPWSTSNPAAYQPRQSLLAIYNGGWFGRGAGNGICKLGYLPEDSTDFIFSVFCEEWGFVGAILLMTLVAAWILLSRRVAVRSENSFGRSLAGGLGFLIAMQAVMHIAVDVGALPATGMGLPFISAGGTALIMAALATAMIVSVSARNGTTVNGEYYRRPACKCQQHRRDACSTNGRNDTTANGVHGQDAHATHGRDARGTNSSNDMDTNGDVILTGGTPAMRAG